MERLSQVYYPALCGNLILGADLRLGLGDSVNSIG